MQVSKICQNKNSLKEYAAKCAAERELIIRESEPDKVNYKPFISKYTNLQIKENPSLILYNIQQEYYNSISSNNNIFIKDKEKFNNSLNELRNFLFVSQSFIH